METECTLKFALLDDDGDLVDTTPEFQAEQVKEAIKVAQCIKPSTTLEVHHEHFI